MEIPWSYCDKRYIFISFSALGTAACKQKQFKSSTETYAGTAGESVCLDAATPAGASKHIYFADCFINEIGWTFKILGF